MMRLREILWKDTVVDKLEAKHGVQTEEVEEILFGRPHVRKAQRGRVPGEDLYVAYGQTQGSRYLVIFFIYKEGAAALPISARDMTGAEQRYYEQHATGR